MDIRTPIHQGARGAVHGHVSRTLPRVAIHWIQDMRLVLSHASSVDLSGERSHVPNSLLFVGWCRRFVLRAPSHICFALYAPISRYIILGRKFFGGIFMPVPVLGLAGDPGPIHGNQKSLSIDHSHHIMSMLFPVLRAFAFAPVPLFPPFPPVAASPPPQGKSTLRSVARCCSLTP